MGTYCAVCGIKTYDVSYSKCCRRRYACERYAKAIEDIIRQLKMFKETGQVQACPIDDYDRESFDQFYYEPENLEAYFEEFASNKSEEDLARNYALLEQDIEERTPFADMCVIDDYGYYEVCSNCCDRIMRGDNLVDLNWIRENAEIKGDSVVIPATDTLKLWVSKDYAPKCPKCNLAMTLNDWGHW